MLDLPPQNVILILADDLGYGDLSCYGAKNVQTPNVDSLSASGIRFVNSHAVASTSTPSRYGILTGEYPFRKKGTDVAAGNAGMIINPNQFTLADVFKARGYTTAAFGKWHLGLGYKTAMQNWNDTLDATPADLGFDYTYIMAATADRVPCVFIENNRVANHDPSAPIYVSYAKNFEGEPTGQSHPHLLTKQKSSHGHNQSIVNGIGRIGYMKGGGKALWRDEDIADSITSHAIQFIERNKEKPFFMYFCTNDIHVPRQPHERYRGKSEMGLRGEAIMQFDDCVGALCQVLREQGILDNTLIIITSDNGPVLDDGYEDMAVEKVGNHKPAGHLRGGKYSNYEAGSCVPFIVSGAGVNAQARGTVSNALVSQIDFLSTCSALVNIDCSESVKPTDSENHLNAWLGFTNEGRQAALKMAYSHNVSLKTKDWKYIPPSNGPTVVPWGTGIETGTLPQAALYDVNADPSEQVNIADQHPAIVAQMDSLLKMMIQKGSINR
ncbi:MAG: sulfatase-like hydrolase/transferase [Bacteroidaceae bacterium]|nr:sulfatase-like hydrolase/transferase [Bacteroidaceae bacterium]